MSTAWIRAAGNWAVCLCCAAASWADGLTAGQSQPSEPVKEIVLRDWLVIEPVGRYGRSAVHTDAIEAEIVAGRWSPPRAGDTVTLPDGTVRTWQSATAADSGWLEHDALNGGYALASVESPTERPMLLDASGHGTAYVNGTPRTGDPYRTGWTVLPVRLEQGTNTFLFQCGRGGVRAKLVEPARPISFNQRDLTLPDLIVGEGIDVWGAIPVINATDKAISEAVLESSLEGGEVTGTPLPPIGPMTVRKVGFILRGPAPTQPGDIPVKLRLLAAADAENELDTTELKLAARKPDDRYKRTFVSEIDDSVQYFAVTPARPGADDTGPPALFLTLHGAGVEATGQAAAYGHKTWGHIVAPTNRRPYGFDWEDWGRLDAMEVLSLAARVLKTDPLRTYLTGHSMGGHGTWQIGATFPDRFAAIAPSAGWISFWSYADGLQYAGDSSVAQILRRAVAPSDTAALSRNYLRQGVYVLHGDQDDNVPVEQARTMRTVLGGYHPDFAYYERPGAGHWWGNECVDWPPLFDFLKQHVRPAPEAVRQVEFVTACPGVSATSDWVTIEAQTRGLIPSSVNLRVEPEKRRFVGTTDNVARLSLDLNMLSQSRQRQVEGQSVDGTVLPAGEPLTIELDSRVLDRVPWPDGEPRIWLTDTGGSWAVGEKPSQAMKGPHRYGPFKDAFRNRFAFVYGTRGAAQENAWAFAKARFDAETFWYRGNGSADVVADTAFDAGANRDRNVILYGNAATNAAWDALLGDSPVQLRPGEIVVGDRTITGDDLACLVIRPRPGSDRATVGVVGGTGLTGMRLTDRLPYFVSGVAYPDCTVLGTDVLTQGIGGVRVVGFFGIDWRIESGDFAWADE